VLRDFVRHGRWLRALAEIARHGLDRSSPARMFDAALGVLSPGMALAVANRFARLPPPAEWFGPAFLNIYASGLRPAPRQMPDARWPAHVTSGVWSQLTHPTVALILETANEEGLEYGVEVRTPFTDVRLIEHMLMIPWAQRAPRGHYRRTGRDALGPLLPPEFAGRTGQEPWTDVWRATARKTARATAPFLVEGPWLSAPFVDRAVAKAMLRDVLTRGPDAHPEAALLVADFAALEAWLRQLLR
jgi:hypothetical protein